MPNTKLEAIRTLQESFKHLPKFKKAWQDYIELQIIEALEEKKIQLKPHEIRELVTTASKKIMILFDAGWWDGQSYFK